MFKALKYLFLYLLTLFVCMSVAEAAGPRYRVVKANFTREAFERHIRGLAPTMDIRPGKSTTTDLESIRVNQIDSTIGSVSFTQSTDANKPLLTEGGKRENLITQSESPAEAIWLKAAYPVSVSGNTITATAGSARHSLYQLTSAIAGQSYRQIFDIEKGNYQYAMVGDAGDAVWRVVTVDMNAGTLHAPTNITASIETISANRYRVVTEFTRTNTGNIQSLVGFSNSLSAGSLPTWTAAGTETLIMHSASLQRASMNPTYIPTNALPRHGSLSGNRELYMTTQGLTSTSTQDDIWNNNSKQAYLIGNVRLAQKDSATVYANEIILTNNSAYSGIYIAATDGFEPFNYDGNVDQTEHVYTAGENYLLYYDHQPWTLRTSLNGGAFESTASYQTFNMTTTLLLGYQTNTSYMSIARVVTLDKDSPASVEQRLMKGFKRWYRVQ